MNTFLERLCLFVWCALLSIDAASLGLVTLYGVASVITALPCVKADFYNLLTGCAILTLLVFVTGAFGYRYMRFEKHFDDADNSFDEELESLSEDDEDDEDED